MKEVTKDRAISQKALTVIGFILVVVINLLYINKYYGLFIMDDMLGYWSHAAHLAGYDWSALTSGINWYSYGYSLLLTVLIRIATLLGGNMFTAYRLAVLVNALFCGCIFLISYKLLRKWIRDSQAIAFFGALLSALYAGLVFNSSAAWSECTLALLTSLLVFLALYNVRRKSCLVAILSGFLAAFMYIIHNREIGILAAFGVYSLCFVAAGDRKIKMAASLLVPIALMLALDKLLGGYLRLRLYGTANHVNSLNTASYVLDKSGVLFSVEGIIAAFRCALGQLWYLGTASYGMAYLGIIHCFVKLKRAIARKEANLAITYGFILLAFLLSGCVSVAWWFNRYLPSREGWGGTMSDFYYGRYVENWIPVLIVFGCVELTKMWKSPKRTWIVLAGVVLFHLAATVSTALVTDWKISPMNYVSVPGIAGLELMFKELDIIKVTLMAIGVFFLIVLASWICLNPGRKRRAWAICILFSVVSTVFVFTGLKVSKLFISWGHSIYEGLATYLVPAETLSLGEEKQVLLNGDVGLAKSFQFMNPSWRIQWIKGRDITPEDARNADFMLMDFKTGVKNNALFKDDFTAKAVQRDQILYERKQITTEAENGSGNIEIPLRYMTPQNGAYINGSIVSNGVAGRVIYMYGQGYALPGGSYTLHMQGRLMQGSTAEGIVIDALCDLGEGKADITNPEDQILDVDGDRFSAQIDFVLEKDATDCEFRMNLQNEAVVSVDRVFLTVEPRTED